METWGVRRGNGEKKDDGQRGRGGKGGKKGGKRILSQTGKKALKPGTSLKMGGSCAKKEKGRVNKKGKTEKNSTGRLKTPVGYSKDHRM